MEKIQERSLRFVYNNYTINYEELLHLSKLPSLKVRRLRSIALETFKIINKNCPSYLYDLIILRNINILSDTVTQLNYPRSELLTRYGINSFRYTASKIWNELPEHFRNETNFNQFSKLISTWTGNSCRCNACK